MLEYGCAFPTWHYQHKWRGTFAHKKWKLNLSSVVALDQQHLTRITCGVVSSEAALKYRLECLIQACHDPTSVSPQASSMACGRAFAHIHSNPMQRRVLQKDSRTETNGGDWVWWKVGNLWTNCGQKYVQSNIVHDENVYMGCSGPWSLGISLFWRVSGNGIMYAVWFGPIIAWWWRTPFLLIAKVITAHVWWYSFCSPLFLQVASWNLPLPHIFAHDRLTLLAPWLSVTGEKTRSSESHADFCFFPKFPQKPPCKSASCALGLHGVNRPMWTGWLARCCAKLYCPLWCCFESLSLIVLFGKKNNKLITAASCASVNIQTLPQCFFVSLSFKTNQKVVMVNDQCINQWLTYVVWREKLLCLTVGRGQNEWTEIFVVCVHVFAWMSKCIMNE